MSRSFEARALALLLPAAFLAAGCAGNPEPGDSGYRFNLNGGYDAMVEAQGTAYMGTAELTTLPGGAVTGSIVLTSPGQVEADVTGTVTDSTFQFESVYVRDGGCEGVLLGTGRIEPEGVAASGSVDIADDCSGSMLAGSFKFSRP